MCIMFPVPICWNFRWGLCVFLKVILFVDRDRAYIRTVIHLSLAPEMSQLLCVALLQIEVCTEEIL